MWAGVVFFLVIDSYQVIDYKEVMDCRVGRVSSPGGFAGS